MRITDAVARSLCGDGIVTGRDENGLYVKYDSMRIKLGTATVEFWHDELHVGSLTLDRSVNAADTIAISDVEGRMRLTIGGS